MIGLARYFLVLGDLVQGIPYWTIALIARFAAASVFWTAGQAKIEGLNIDLPRLRLELGVPHLSETALELFTFLYRLPVDHPATLFLTAAVFEHLAATLILVGLFTRLASLTLLSVTVGIEFWVYPESYATYAIWFATLLHLLARGPGCLSIDHLLERLWAGPGAQQRHQLCKKTRRLSSGGSSC